MSFRLLPVSLIDVYRTVVFPDRFGKEMGAVILGDKVQVRNMGWKKGGSEGREAWVTDGAGRKPTNKVGIVRTRILEIPPPQLSSEALQPIDHGRITLQRNILF